MVLHWIISVLLFLRLSPPSAPPAYDLVMLTELDPPPATSLSPRPAGDRGFRFATEGDLLASGGPARRRLGLRKDGDWSRHLVQGTYAPTQSRTRQPTFTLAPTSHHEPTAMPTKAPSYVSPTTAPSKAPTHRRQAPRPLSGLPDDDDETDMARGVTRVDAASRSSLEALALLPAPSPQITLRVNAYDDAETDAMGTACTVERGRCTLRSALGLAVRLVGGGTSVVEVLLPTHRPHVISQGEISLNLLRGRGSAAADSSSSGVVRLMSTGTTATIEGAISTDRFLSVGEGVRLELVGLRIQKFFTDGDGAAVMNNGRVVAYRTAFTHNMARQAGGAIHNGPGASILLRHCTFRQNVADGEGPDVFNAEGAALVSWSNDINIAKSVAAERFHRRDSLTKLFFTLSASALMPLLCLPTAQVADVCTREDGGPSVHGPIHCLGAEARAVIPTPTLRSGVQLAAVAGKEGGFPLVLTAWHFEDSEDGSCEAGSRTCNLRAALAAAAHAGVPTLIVALPDAVHRVDRGEMTVPQGTNVVITGLTRQVLVDATDSVGGGAHFLDVSPGAYVELTWVTVVGSVRNGGQLLAFGSAFIGSGARGVLNMPRASCLFRESVFVEAGIGNDYGGAVYVSPCAMDVVVRGEEALCQREDGTYQYAYGATAGTSR
jgi:hypothetical protein